MLRMWSEDNCVGCSSLSCSKRSNKNVPTFYISPRNAHPVTLVVTSLVCEEAHLLWTNNVWKTTTGRTSRGFVQHDLMLVVRALPGRRWGVSSQPCWKDTSSNWRKASSFRWSDTSQVWCLCRRTSRLWRWVWGLGERGGRLAYHVLLYRCRTDSDRFRKCSATNKFTDWIFNA